MVERQPPKIVFRGDWKAGQSLVRPGKQELMRTADHADRLNVSHYRRTTELDDERGSYIITQVDGPLQRITIVVPVIEVEIPEAEIIVEEVALDERELKVGLYSGFSFTHQLGLTGDDDFALFDFNPTQACRKAFPNDFTEFLTYEPSTRLAVYVDESIKNSGDPDHFYGQIDSWRYDFQDNDIGQSNLVHPCAYSGPVARIVSLVSGNGTLGLSPGQPQEVLDSNTTFWYVQSSFYYLDVEFDFHYERIHTAIKDNTGQWWVIEINMLQGIFAHKLSMVKGFKLPAEDDKSDEAEAIREFGGLPSGEAIQASLTKKNQMIAAGTLYELMSADDIGSYFDAEQMYGQSMGWVFNKDGNKGRLTTFRYNPSGWFYNTYWEISLKITINNSGDVFPSAKISILDEGILAVGAHGTHEDPPGSHNITPAFGVYGDLPLVIYEPEDDTSVIFSLPTTLSLYNTPAKFAEVPDTTDMVVWVGWIDDTWHEIRFKTEKFIEWYNASTDGFLNKIPRTNWTFSGIVEHEYGPDTNAWYKIITSYSPYFPSVEYTIPWSEFNRVEVTSNKAINSNVTVGFANSGTIFQPGSFVQLWNCTMIREIRHVKTTLFAKRLRQVYFIIPPYNRNAYFIHEEHIFNGGGTKVERYALAYDNATEAYEIEWKYWNPCPANPPPGDQTQHYGTVFVTTPTPPGWSSVSYSLSTTVFAPETVTSMDVDVVNSTVGGEEACAAGFANQWSVDQIHTVKAGPGIYNYPSPPGAPTIIPVMDILKGTGWGSFTLEQVLTDAQVGGLYDATIQAPYGFQLTVNDIYEPEHFTNLYLVDAGLPDISFRDLGVVTEFEGLMPSLTNNKWLVQSAVLGEKASIYTDWTNFTYGPDEIPAVSEFPYFFPTLTIEGKMPAMPLTVPGNLQFPTTHRNWHYTYLTFIGVNGP